MKPHRPKPVLLIILDGWGVRKGKKGNSIALANTPMFDWLDTHAKRAVLGASGKDVGLPHGFQGNSEVGHLNLGAGRVVKEIMTRIDESIRDGSFYANPALFSAITNCKRYSSALHIIGLVQNEGVHAMTRHGVALLRLAKKHHLNKVWIHFITDGRDTQPQSAKQYSEELVNQSKSIGLGTPATLVGRYYALDRDSRWGRTKKAFDLIVSGKGIPEKDPLSAIAHAYAHSQTDEFITPRVFPGYPGLKANDSVIFFNYRLDRPRQLTHALTDDQFPYFSRNRLPFKIRARFHIKNNKKSRTSTFQKNGTPNIHFVAMTRYYKELPCPVAFEQKPMKKILGEVLSRNNLRQVRIAETEKYAHVTYFFNGEEETPFPGEDRIFIPSKKVATYDLQPEMSAEGITTAALTSISERKHDVIILNFANGDMVGHTGDLKATIEAVEFVDSCVGKLVHAVDQHCGVTIITADHGNCEEKKKPFETSHTLNPVPMYVIGSDIHDTNGLTKARLADVAPTMLQILGIKKPKEMTGKSLV